MAKFKKGDRVMAITDGYYHKKHEKGIINEDNSDVPYVIWESGKEDASNEQDLEMSEVQVNYQIY